MITTGKHQLSTSKIEHMCYNYNIGTDKMEERMTALPTLAFRGALLMSFLMVLACLALSNSATLASTEPADLSHAPNVQAASSASNEISSLNTCELNEQYPASILQWCDLITQHADENGLPPSLIAALIWQESGGNPLAYSASGAVGLMQVMPLMALLQAFCASMVPALPAAQPRQSLRIPNLISNMAHACLLVCSHVIKIYAKLSCATARKMLAILMQIRSWASMNATVESDILERNPPV